MMHFVINFVLVVVSFVAAYEFGRSLLAEEQMGYKAPFLLRLGFGGVVWFSQLITGLIFLWIAEMLFPLLEFQPYAWLWFTTGVSVIILLSSYLPDMEEQKKKAHKPLLVPKEENTAKCGPFLREIGLFIMETVERFSDEKLKESRLAWLVCATRLYYEGKDCSYADHVFNILDLEYQTRLRKKQLNK